MESLQKRSFGSETGAGQPEFIALPLDTLRMDTILECQIYIKTVAGKYVKYRDAGITFDEDARHRLQENRHTHIFISNKEVKALNKYLEGNLVEVLKNPKIPDEKKSEILYGTTTNIVRQLLKEPRSSEGVKQCKTHVEASIDFILSSNHALRTLIDMISLDYYTYTHSVNVLTFSIPLAKRFGIPEGEELFEVGVSALLHDIGKSYIDSRITNKGGPLTPSEFSMMKRHTDYGYRSLRQTGEVSEYVLFAVRHHHEKLNGKGYPLGLTQPQIDIPTRIISVTDIYDALTTRRVYRKAYSSFAALRLMKEVIGSEIDEKVFSEFVRMLGEV